MFHSVKIKFLFVCFVCSYGRRSFQVQSREGANFFPAGRFFNWGNDSQANNYMKVIISVRGFFTVGQFPYEKMLVSVTLG